MAFRLSVIGIGAAVALATSFSAAAQTDSYPNRPINLVVPFAPGGSSDILARALGASLSEHLNETVVVENRPGAGGAIAASYVARAQPDGYTLLFGTIGTHGINPAIKKETPYDVTKDFTALGRLQDGPLVLVAHPKVGAKTLPELLKKKETELYYASAGIGSISHLGGALFKSATDMNITHVPYKGGGAAMPDLLSGQVQLMLETIPNSLGAVRDGRLHALAVSSESRSPALPEVPTFRESNLPELNVTTWTGLFGPAGVPEDIANKLNSAIAAIAKDPKYIERIEQTGSIVATPMSAKEFANFVESEVKRWHDVAEKAGVEPT